MMSLANIMIVEDNTLVAEDCRDCLEGLGYGVTSIVASGEESIVKADEERPDAVLMDICLSDEIDGIDAAAKIHSRFQIPVVFLSAYSDRELLERANRVGSFGYLIKPFDERELYATLEMAMYKSRAEKEHRMMEARLRQAQKMESIGTLAGGIAHEFNNILGIIVGNTELALGDLPQWNPVRDNLEEVIKASLRARDMVKQILSFSRQSEEEQKPVRIRPIIEKSLKLLRSSTTTAIEMQEYFSTHADTVLGDPTQISQILMNLGTNATYAMRDKGGVLKVSLENMELDQDAAAFHHDLTAGKYVVLTMSDTGHGIEPEIVERIFDPYFTTKRVGEGTGMGLAVVHGIVRKHRGAIRVDREPGKGATFQVFLPLFSREADLVSEIEAEATSWLPTGKERVLFVDDERALADLWDRMLSHLGYEITVRTSSLDALETFRAQPDEFDLVVTDMAMPNMTGKDLSRELLRLRPDIPIILCTGFSEIITEDGIEQMGVKAFVMKPLIIQEIAQTVRRVLDLKKG